MRLVLGHAGLVEWEGEPRDPVVLRTVEIGACGHINGASNLGDWPAGWALVLALTADPPLADR